MWFLSYKKQSESSEQHYPTLEEILRPIWKFTYYSGVTQDWCQPIPRNFTFTTIHFLFVILSLFLFTFGFIFELVQLVLVIQSTTYVHELIPNLMWLAPLPLALVTQIKYIRCRHDFLRFFRQWRQLEKNLEEYELRFEPVNRLSWNKKIQRTMCVIYLVMAILSMFSVGFEIFYNPTLSFLVSYYEIVRELFPLSFIIVFTLLSIFLIWVSLSLIDIVPAFVYFQAAEIIDRLEKICKQVFSQNQFLDETFPYRTQTYFNYNRHQSILQKNIHRAKLDIEEPLNFVRVQIENLNVLMMQANFTLFGTSLVIGQGMSIFVITILLYSVLNNISYNLQYPDRFMAPFFSFIALAFRSCSCTIILSQLYRSVANARTSLIHQLGWNWCLIKEKDRDILSLLITRLRDDNLAACPLGLYKITSMTLFTISSLVIGYVIVLLQSY